MPAVFVHGVPDTPEVWDAVVSRRMLALVGQLERPAEVAAELERHWSAV